MSFDVHISGCVLVRPQRGQGSSQSGYATLTIAIVLLIILSLMSIYLTRSGIMDIRSSANKVRYAKALAQAEDNLEKGFAWFGVGANRASVTPSGWAGCDALDASYRAKDLGTAWKCFLSSSVGTPTAPVTAVPTGASFVIATPAAPAADVGRTFMIVAQGTSDDGTARAVVRQGVYFFSTAGISGAPPMMGAGNIPINGSYTVVPNPNGGGKGVPVSVWSKVSISNLSGAAQTCQLGEYLAGACSANAISSSAGKGPDIVDNDSNFPADVFEFVTGYKSDQYQTVKLGATVVADCTNLTGLTGRVWVTGACTIPSGSTIGSEIAPLQLFVENADFTMNANSTFYGMLVAFGTPANSYAAGDIKANGGARFYGSMISNDPTSMGLQINGTFDMVFLPGVIDAITNNTEFKSMARIPGSWADFLN